MKRLTKETWMILKLNLRSVLWFELLYRAAVLPVCFRLFKWGLSFSLKMAGYSYVTAGNLWSFLLKPWTLAVMAALMVLGLALCLVETGALITAFQGAAYYQKRSPAAMLQGGLEKLSDELRRGNWQLFPVLMAHMATLNWYLIYRILSHVRPLNFVMSELLHQPWGLAAAAGTAALCLACTAVTVFVFQTCMIEQRKFGQAVYESGKLLRGNAAVILGTMALHNLAVLAIFILIYLAFVLLAAIFVTLWIDSSISAAMLLSVCDRAELVILFGASMMVTVVNVAAATVRYYETRGWRGDRDETAFRLSVGRHMKYGICIAACFSLFFLVDMVYNGSELAEEMLTDVAVTAHRGSSQKAPENTMAALEAAVEELADFAEIDVQLTSDKEMVLCHDLSLKRTAGVSRTVSSMTLGEIRQLDAGSWFSEEFAGEQIPTLREAMEFAKGRLNLNIELKNLGKDSELPELAAELIRELDMEEQCVVTSVNFSYLERVKKQNPRIRTGYIAAAAYGDYYSGDSIDFISVRASLVSGSLVEQVHELGKEIHVWTVNSRQEMERMKFLNVDNLITDYPVRAREVIYKEEATENLLEYLNMILK